MRFKIIICLIISSIIINAQECITINKVFVFTPGKGQNLGQSEEYFPSNIFGIPSRIANEDIAEASQNDVLSIGFGGEIIVGNTDFLIVDEEGNDFTIFENVFLNPISGRLFKEPAVVSVSKDGINFIEFPYDFASLDGCAGTHPTYGDKDYCNSEISGGDSFDLTDLQIDSIRYIKIKDITDKVKANESHKYFDFSLSGFDLDAVVIHNYVKEPITSVEKEYFESYVIYNNAIISKSQSNNIQIYDLNGVLVMQFSGIGTFRLENIGIGVYLIKISNNRGFSVENFINL